MNSKNLKLYMIGTVISGNSFSDYFNRVERALVKEGYEVVHIARLANVKNLISKKAFDPKKIMRLCAKELADCDEVVRSKVSMCVNSDIYDLEHSLAYKFGMQIKDLDAYTRVGKRLRDVKSEVGLND